MIISTVLYNYEMKQIKKSVRYLHKYKNTKFVDAIQNEMKGNGLADKHFNPITRYSSISGLSKNRTNFFKIVTIRFIQLVHSFAVDIQNGTYVVFFIKNGNYDFGS